MSPGSSRLHGQVAVVTGASSGLGAAIARALAEGGAAVVGVARRFAATKLQSSPVPKAVTERRLDVTGENAVKAFFAELAQVDILVNCAGTGTFTKIMDTDAASLREMLDVHVVGAFLCTREALRSMSRRLRGHVVNVSSIAAFHAFPSCGGYSAAKEGLRGFTRVLAEEAREWNVRVTGLYPGAIDTPIWGSRAGFNRADMLRPERVAELVVELVSRPDLSVEELVVLPPKGIL
ncbi:MAG: SDR family oxidoreductase [Deltaproteobacteria bacterium]|nr:SDR family oxidoreductase [Deltaproteobacteria bacterium]